MKRYLPLLIIAVLMGIAYLSGVGQYISLDSIKANRQTLIQLVTSHPLGAPFAYIMAYALLVALSFPGAVFLTLLAGFLFPQPLAMLVVMVGATSGAIVIFLAARMASGDFFRKKAGPFLKKMEDGFQDDAISYLLFLRLVPIFPFWLCNLAPAFFEIPLRTFAWTTFLGIIPGTFVYSQAGKGLGAILDSDQSFSVAAILNDDMKVALLGLGIVALIPIAIKKFWRAK